MPSFLPWSHGYRQSLDTESWIRCLSDLSKAFIRAKRCVGLQIGYFISKDYWDQYIRGNYDGSLGSNQVEQELNVVTEGKISFDLVSLSL